MIDAANNFIWLVGMLTIILITTVCIVLGYVYAYKYILDRAIREHKIHGDIKKAFYKFLAAQAKEYVEKHGEGYHE